MEKRFFGDIEKLRGIACVLVLIQHIALIVPLKFVYTILNPYLLVGSGGVHIFFAITGFVITMSLRNKGLFQDERLFVDRFNLHKYTLVDFYKKRFLRIFPVVMFVFVGVGVFFYFTQDKSDWVLVFLRAPIEIICGVYNYSVEWFCSAENLHLSGGVGPFWYIAVVFQYYLLWPIIMLVCKDNNVRMLLSLILGLVFLYVVQPIMTNLYGFKYYAMYGNVSELFLGSFFAFVFNEKQIRATNKTTSTIMILLSVMVVWFYPGAVDSQFFTHGIVQSMGSVFALIIAVFCTGCLNIPLFGNIFKFLGERSFSFYVVQLLLANITVWFTNSVYFSRGSMTNYEFYACEFMIFLIAQFVVTECVYRFIEKPCRKLGNK